MLGHGFTYFWGPGKSVELKDVGFEALGFQREYSPEALSCTGIRVRAKGACAKFMAIISVETWPTTISSLLKPS